MKPFIYHNKKADPLEAEPLVPSEPYNLAKSSRPRSFWRLISWIFNFIFFVVICIQSTKLAMKVNNVGMDLACLQLQSAWSPALEAALPIHNVRFNGTLDHPSPFRGTPGPEVDAAWESITHSKDVGVFGISETEFRNLNIPLTENTVRLRDEQGGGFNVGLEVFHQLHCLNLLRKFTYAEYYSTRDISWTDPPDLLRTHVDHCIEILRQKLLCDADVGVISRTWVAQRKAPWPNFNVVHQCRNFEGVVEWSLRNNVPYFGVPMRPEGVRGVGLPP